MNVRNVEKSAYKKVKLSKVGRQTKWTPFWVILKKFGIGKKIHPSATTRIKRHWRRNKLHIKPRKSNTITHLQ